MKSDGTGLTNLAAIMGYTGNEQYGYGIAWTPDGSRIVFSAKTGPDEVQLGMVHPDGSGAFLIPNSASGSVNDVVVSPSGTQIAWRSPRTEVINIDGTGRRQLSPFSYSKLAWSRDGTQVYGTIAEGPGGLPLAVYAYNVDGSGTNRVMSGAYPSIRP